MSRRADIEDYVHGALDGDAAASFEDALFASADAQVAREVREVLDFADAIKSVRAREASIGMTCLKADLDAFRARGGRIDEWAIDDGATLRRGVSPDTMLMVGRLPLVLDDVRRVDLEIAEARGPSRFPRVNDVDVDRAEGCVWVPCAPHVALSSEITTFRLFAHHTDGRVTTHEYTAEIG